MKLKLLTIAVFSAFLFTTAPQNARAGQCTAEVINFAVQEAIGTGLFHCIFQILLNGNNVYVNDESITAGNLQQATQICRRDAGRTATRVENTCH